MNNIRGLFVAGLTTCLFLISACNTTKNTETFLPVAASANNANLYVYRPANTTNALYSPDLYLNDEFKLSIKNGTNTRISMMPGGHIINIDRKQQYSGTTSLKLKLAAGNNYYVRISSALKIINATNYQPYQRSFNLTVVDEAMAINEISDCCLQINNKNVSNPEIAADKKSEKKGFSVDKTQNPFSH